MNDVMLILTILTPSQALCHVVAKRLTPPPLCMMSFVNAP